MSFFARRILVSPIDIARLISLISLMFRPTRSSRALIDFCAITTSGLMCSKDFLEYFLLVINESIHFTFVIFSWNIAIKSFLGIFADLTKRYWILFSCNRSSAKSFLAIKARSSNIFGENFKNLKIKLNLENSALASFECLPLDSITFCVLLN